MVTGGLIGRPLAARGPTSQPAISPLPANRIDLSALHQDSVFSAIIVAKLFRVIARGSVLRIRSFFYRLHFISAQSPIKKVPVGF